MTMALGLLKIRIKRATWHLILGMSLTVTGFLFFVIFDLDIGKIT